MINLYPLKNPEYAGMRNRLHGVVRNGRDYVDPVEPPPSDSPRPISGNPCVEGCGSQIRYSISMLGVMGTYGIGSGGRRVDKVLKTLGTRVKR